MPYTIISALKDILVSSQDSQLKTEKLESCSEALHYITKELHINEFQAILLSIVINNDEEIYTMDISSYLDISLLEFLIHMPDIDELVNRKYLRRITSPEEIHPSYKIQKAAINALMKEEEYIAQPIVCNNYIQFMTWIKKLHDNLASRQICTDEYKTALLQLTHDNQHLPLCRKVKDMSANDQIVYYTCADDFVSTHAEVTPLKEIIRLFRNDVYTPIMNALLNHQFPLLNQGLIYYNNEEETEICLAESIRQHLQEEIHLLRLLQDSVRQKNAQSNTPTQDIPLIKYHTIKKKELIYNKEEEEGITRLCVALQARNFNNVQLRLKQNNMQEGITCLFYGSPGTGKTETVHQIAKSTERHILQVDFAEIRSKWVGDSEKNIRNLFSHYRLLCQQEENIPILLINEADGLISQRVTDLSDTNDKTENTLQNIILEELEHFEGILIATTNLQDNLDPAFERRFLYKIQFHQPTVEARQKIWQNMFHELQESDTLKLAERYAFSGAQIENITRKILIDNTLTGQNPSWYEIQKICMHESLDSLRKPKPIVGFGFTE